VDQKIVIEFFAALELMIRRLHDFSSSINKVCDSKRVLVVLRKHILENQKIESQTKL